MVGRISKKKRSHIMSCIRSKNTKVEMLLRRAIWAKGLRYRVHAQLIGKPDLLFARKRVVVFVDGDFWHGYNFKSLRHKLKTEFWIRKIEQNMARDKEVTIALQKKGFRVVRFWEHNINNNLSECVREIIGLVG